VSVSSGASELRGHHGTMVFAQGENAPGDFGRLPTYANHAERKKRGQVSRSTIGIRQFGLLARTKRLIVFGSWSFLASKVGNRRREFSHAYSPRHLFHGVLARKFCSYCGGMAVELLYTVFENEQDQASRSAWLCKHRRGFAENR